MHDVCIQEVMVEVSIHNVLKVGVSEVLVEPNYNQEQEITDQTLHKENIDNEPEIVEPQEITLKRSQKERRSAILITMWFNLYESEIHLGIENNQFSFSQAMKCDDFTI